MNQEIKICQNCQGRFTVESPDFTFYEKIKVPPPTFCPDCRLQRKLLWRNERTLHKCRCGLCGKSLIAMYPADVPMPVYCSQCWWSDGWDPQTHGMVYDFQKPFFEQFRALLSRVPAESLQGRQNINSEYANFLLSSKNTYLSYVIIESENVAYSRSLIQAKECVDCSYATKIAQCVRVTRAGFSDGCTDSMLLENCRNVHMSFDCADCSDCYGCINLRHKSYHIFNQPYDKEGYEKKLAELRSVSPAVQQKKVDDFFRTQPRRGFIHFFSKNVSGEEIYYSVNCRHCRLANFVRDSAYIFNVTSLSRSNETVSDVFDAAVVADIQLGYELMGGSKSYQTKFGIINDNCLETQYSMFCYGSQKLFGCIGLRNKSYCIFNKQYSKEEYEKVVPQIIQHMSEMPYTDKKGRVYKYGEFFPPELSPFAYNETIAQEYFPLAEEQIKEQGYRWRAPAERNYKISMSHENVPDRIQDIADSILNEVIGCAHGGGCLEQCTEAFRIIPQELEFYRKAGLSPPKLCPNCRHHQRIKQRNPVKLWPRTCMCTGELSENGVYRNQTEHFHGKTHCSKTFETPYESDVGFIVYCDECYKQEIL